MNWRMVSASLLVASTTAVSLPAAALQSYSYPYAHLNYVEGDVTVQRASKPEPEPGTVNVPIFPGDRLWTQDRSRAEVVFADGTVLRLGERTKLDFEEIDKEILIRLWSGSLIVKLEEPRVSVRVDAPAASVYPGARGTYRLDVDAERLSLAVFRGSAELASSDGSVLVGAGEQSEIAPGLSPSTPRAFNTALLDELGEWSESRDRRAARTQDLVVQSLPHEIHRYTDDLDEYGAWQRDTDYGYVWYPNVSQSWAPYRDGWWDYTGLGFTWVSYEPWGWAPYHYGRWGYGHRGWYWIPGAYWSPAWVSFAFGPAWIGWSPLGFHNRPVFGFDSVFHDRRHFRGGKGFPGHHGDECAGWNFVDRGRFGQGGGRARLGADDILPSAHRARVFESGAVLRRDLTPMEPGVARKGALDARAVSRKGVPRRLTSPVDSSSIFSHSGRPELGSNVARERSPSKRGDPRSMGRFAADRRDGKATPGTTDSSARRSSAPSGAFSRGSFFGSSPSRAVETGSAATPEKRERTGAAARSPRRSESSGRSRLGSESTTPGDRNRSSMGQPTRPSTGTRTREPFGRSRLSSARPDRSTPGLPTTGGPRSSSTRAPRAVAGPSSGRGGSVGVQRGAARGSRGSTGSRGNRPR